MLVAGDANEPGTSGFEVELEGDEYQNLASDLLARYQDNPNPSSTDPVIEITGTCRRCKQAASAMVYSLPVATYSYPVLVVQCKICGAMHWDTEIYRRYKQHPEN